MTDEPSLLLTSSFFKKVTYVNETLRAKSRKRQRKRRRNEGRKEREERARD
jgi:hypothetical protein